MTLFSLSLILFLIMDPIGNIPSFLKLKAQIPKERVRFVLMREMGVALFVMLLFNGLGEWIFYMLHFCETSLRIASGLILFLVALKILFPTTDSPRAHLPEGETNVFPLAIPLLAGPALLASIMLFAHLEPSQPLMWGAIFLSWGAASLVLLSAPILEKVLGKNGLIACERLMGMVLVLLAIQRLLEGVQLFVTGKC